MEQNCETCGRRLTLSEFKQSENCSQCARRFLRKRKLPWFAAIAIGLVALAYLVLRS